MEIEQNRRSGSLLGQAFRSAVNNSAEVRFGAKEAVFGSIIL